VPPRGRSFRFIGQSSQHRHARLDRRFHPTACGRPSENAAHPRLGGPGCGRAARAHDSPRRCEGGERVPGLRRSAGGGRRRGERQSDTRLARARPAISSPRGSGPGRAAPPRGETGVRHRSAEGLLVGSDCPRLEPRHLREAEAALEENDLVFGPAQDGGYYLVGWRRVLPSLFEPIPWGSGEVLEVSLRRAAEYGVTSVLLETLPDVDLPDALAQTL